MTGTVGRRLRAGFTLIELLVVLALIVLIAALAVAVANSGIIGSQKVVSGGDRASGWLLIAKMRALRDQAPRGVRFFLTPQDGGTFFAATEAQYIEAPDPWNINPYGSGQINPARTNSAGQTFNTGARLGRIVFLYREDNPNVPGYVPVPGVVAFRQVFLVSDDVDDITEFTQRIPTETLPGAGDGRAMLLMPDFPNPFRIRHHKISTVGFNLQDPAGNQTTQTYMAGDPRVRELDLDSYPDLGAALSQVPTGGSSQRTAYVTYNFAFQEPPRPLVGEPTLQLTLGTLIDFRPGPYRVLGDPGTPPYNPPSTFGVDAVGGSFDVLFSPSGQVLHNPSPLICLWVRDAEKLRDFGNHPRLLSPTTGTGLDDPTLWDNAGDQILVTVYPKTGMIATHPIPKPTGAAGYDPYSYAKDGVNSGL